MHPTWWWVVFTMVACRGCASCSPQIDLPNTNPNDDDPIDTSGPDETADTGIEDTAAPPPCDFPEVEPNNNFKEPNAIPREEWACGIFDFDNDQDWFVFEGFEKGWISVDVSAADMGSPADLTMVVADEDYTVAALTYDGGQTEDPRMVFPSLGHDSYLVSLYEASAGSGEDYRWKMRVSEVKCPVSWTTTEVEPNDTPAEGSTHTSGDVVWGTLDRTSDYDWFHFSVPEGKTTLHAVVEAFGSGSPADTRLVLYDSEYLTNPDAVWLTRVFAGPDVYDKDPDLEYTFSEAGDYYLLVREDSTAMPGSPFHWYTIAFTLEASTDTGAPATQ